MAITSLLAEAIALKKNVNRIDKKVSLG